VLTASSDKTARVWDAATGKLLAELKGHSGHVGSAVFSPDGARVLTASADNTARIWDAATFRSLAELKGHSGEVTSAVFSPDGERVLTASSDGTARIWRVLGSTPGPTPSWFANFFRVAACRTFSEDGELVPLAGPEWARMKAEVRAAALGDKTRYGQIARWYFGDSAP
jgi:WD40 repeat protein